MNEPKGLIDYYDYYDIPYDASAEEIEDILNYEMKNALSSDEKTKIQLAEEYLLVPTTKQSYDAYLKRHRFDKDVRKAEQKRKKVFKIVKKVILVGSLIAVGLTAHNYKEAKEQENFNNNVCIEYSVQEGDSYEFLEENFEDYSIVDTEVTGPYRNTDYVYEGDVVVGRTTKEIADKLVEDGTATIISVQEAIEILNADGSLKGVFKAYANGESEFVFYQPTNGKKI